MNERAHRAQESHHVRLHRHRQLNTRGAITIPLDAEAGQAVLTEIKDNTLLTGERVSIVGTDSGPDRAAGPDRRLMTTISATTILRPRNLSRPEDVLSTLLLRYACTAGS